MLGDIARLVGRRPPLLRMPRRLLFPAAAVAEMWATRTGREPFLTRDGLRMAKLPMHVLFQRQGRAGPGLPGTSGYAKRRRVDAIDWFRGVGYVRWYGVQ